MCERDQIERWQAGGAFDWTPNRRQFMAAGLAGATAACATVPGSSDSTLVLREEEVRIPTPDGVIDAFFVAPARGRYPAILTWPDIAGLREAFRVMARRLAGQGHAVLVVNPYYRTSAAPHFRDWVDFQAQSGFTKVRPWRAQLTAPAIQRDARAIVAWLDRRREVDPRRGIGTHGYCMGGPFTVWSAAAVPTRIKAAASLHGGGLVRPNDPLSPHVLIGQTEARFMFAFGQDDHREAPEVVPTLQQVAAATGRPSEIEVYPADHGWTVIDAPAYERVAAERAWSRMSALFALL